MKELTEKQEMYQNYLISRIGYANDAFLKKYLYYLEIVSPRFKMLGIQKKKWDEESNSYYPEKANPYKTYVEKEDYFIPKTFDLIDFLSAETDIRKSNKYLEKGINFSHISATDISSFTFCPISYAISKTFELESLESTLIGNSQHEKQTLTKYLKEFTGQKNEEERDEKFHHTFYGNNESFFAEINKSRLLYSGHSNNEKKYFKSKKGNFIGQPDYIFINNLTESAFVVEEKFQFVPSSFTAYGNKVLEKKRGGNLFYDNHINQLNSYIYGINDYKIEYGYLVYWKYEIIDDLPNVVSCNVLKINKTEEFRHNLIQTYIGLKDAILNKGGKFNPDSRNPAKCASCVSSVLCGHKTGNYEKYEIPYSKEYYKLKYIEFPEELKRPNIEVIPNQALDDTNNNNGS